MRNEKEINFMVEIERLKKLVEEKENIIDCMHNQYQSLLLRYNYKYTLDPFA